MHKGRILVVEDASDLATVISDRFRREGYAVKTVGDGESALTAAAEDTCDLMLLDVMLPGISGFDVCRELRRRHRDIPILMLTARTETVDKIAGLKLGADDYVTKPFDFGELTARVEALMRRAPHTTSGVETRLQFGEVDVDLRGAEVFRKGCRVELTAREFRLLRCLIENRGVVLSRRALMKDVWNYDVKLRTRTLDVHIAWLRQKLEEHPAHPRYIVTVRGVGYKFAV